MGGANANDYYDWTVPAGGTITAGGDGIGSTTVTVNWGSTGSNTITVQQQNNQAPATGVGPFASSCNTTTSFTVNVRNTPTATLQWNGTAATTDDQVCEGNSITLNVTSGPANGTVQLYDMNAAAVVTGGGAFNPGTLGLPIASASLNGSGAGSVTLTTTTGTITGTAVFPGSAAVIFRVALIDALSNGAQCGTTLTTPTLTIFDEPTAPSITGTEPICPGQFGLVPPATNASVNSYSVSNTGSFPVGTTYTWTLFPTSGTTPLTYGTNYIVSGGAAALTNNAGTVTGLQLHPSVLTSVRWRVQVNYPTSSGSCSKTFDWGTSPVLAGAQAEVTVNPVPTPNITGADANGTLSLTPTPGLCSGQTATYASNDPGPTYAWTISGAPAGTTTGAANAATFSVTWGTFNSPALVTPVLSVVATNGSGCSQADTQTVYIRPVPAGPIAQVVPTNGPCVFNSENSHIVAYTVPKSASYVIQSVTWTVSSGGAVYSYTTTNSAQVSPGANDTLRVQWYATGAQTIDATVMTTAGCTTVLPTFNTFVYPVPTPLISGSSSVCKGASTTYNVNPNVAGDTYTWEIIAPASGNTLTGPTSGLGVVSVTANWTGSPNTSYTLRCTQVSAMGCTARTTFSVVVNPNPVPVVTGPTQVCANQVVTYSTNNNSPNNSYAWTITNGAPGSASFVGGINNTASVQVNTGVAGSFQIKVLETVLATSCNTETA
ncbi:MAG: hypothetical protein ACKOBV_10605, partial [Candidatus Kapaibacterium sp.]